MNNPVALSRLNANNERDKQLRPEYNMFTELHKVEVPMISDTDIHELKNKIQRIKEQYE